MAVAHNPQPRVVNGAWRPMSLELTSTLEAVEADTEGGLRMDESAFGEFYEQTSMPLLRFLVCITRQPDLAEDILQETYCRLLTTRLPAMDDRQMRNYLFRIASNLVPGRWRRSKDELAAEKAVEVPAPASYLERKLVVRQAFDRLKPRASSSGSLTSKVPAIKKSPNPPACAREASACCCFARAARWPTSSSNQPYPSGRCPNETEFLHQRIGRYRCPAQ